MKFAQQFEFHMIPEWLEYYLHYEKLKNLFKLAVEQESNNFK